MAKEFLGQRCNIWVQGGLRQHRISLWSRQVGAGVCCENSLLRPFPVLFKGVVGMKSCGLANTRGGRSIIKTWEAVQSFQKFSQLQTGRAGRGEQAPGKKKEAGYLNPYTLRMNHLAL